MKTSQSTSPVISEEWIAVICGLVIVGIYLCGLNIPAPTFSWNNSEQLFNTVFNTKNISAIAINFFSLLLITGLGQLVLGKPIRNYSLAFSIIYALTIVAMVIAGHRLSKDFNLEPVIFSLLTGLILGNIFLFPSWFRDSLAAEFLVKIGLVLLGSSVIFSDLLHAGFLGILQALIVVISVWYFSFWIARKFGIEKDMNLMLASAVSICGVSAAIATSGAIKGDPKKLSYVISLVLITAVPMMLLMPPAAKMMSLSAGVTGAWIGGTIDTTGAVVAAGTIAGEEALKTSTIVKFSQNVLLGLAAFFISIYWTYTNNPSAEKPSVKMLWNRFPKFVLGFLFVSLLFSFLIDKSVVAGIKNGIKGLQTTLFTIAFVSIGLETRFSELFLNKENKKPLYVFLIAQLFNILITLALASLLF